MSNNAPLLAALGQVLREERASITRLTEDNEAARRELELKVESGLELTQEQTDLLKGFRDLAGCELDALQEAYTNLRDELANSENRATKKLDEHHQDLNREVSGRIDEQKQIINATRDSVQGLQELTGHELGDLQDACTKLRTDLVNNQKQAGHEFNALHNIHADLRVDLTDNEERSKTAHEEAKRGISALFDSIHDLTDQNGEFLKRASNLEQIIEQVRETFPNLDCWLSDGQTRTPGTVLSHRGGAWQARVSTQDEPGSSADWALLIDGIHDIRQQSRDHGQLEFTVEFASGRQWFGKLSLPLLNFRGRWTKDQEYAFYDVSVDDGHSWAAINDQPQGRPSESEDWKLLGMRGARGRKGERGERGSDGSDGYVPDVEEVAKQWREYLEGDNAVAINRYRGAWEYNGRYDRGDVISVGRGLYLSTASGPSEVPPGPMDDGRWLMLVEPLAFGGGGGGGSGADELVGVTENDTTPGYLSGKLQSDNGSVVFSIINAGGDEILDLQATGEGGGEANVGSNVGGGTELYKAKNGVSLEIRTVGSTASVVPALNGDLLELTVQDGIVVPAPHDHDAFAGPGTTGFVPDPVTDTGKFLSEDGTWKVAPVSPTGGITLGYRWDSGTTAVDPGDGRVAGNNADHTLITELYINDESRFGNDTGFVIESRHVGSYIGLWEETGDTEGLYLQILSEPVDNTGWHTISVAVVPGEIGGMENNRVVSLFFINNPLEQLPPGGTTGQHLAKASDVDYDAEWVNAGSGGGVRQEWTATVGQDTWSVPYVVGYLDVFLNGDKLVAADFTATNGTSFTLVNPAAENDTVAIIAWATIEAYNSASPILVVNENLAGRNLSTDPIIWDLEESHNYEIVVSNVAGWIGQSADSILRFHLHDESGLLSGTPYKYGGTRSGEVTGLIQLALWAGAQSITFCPFSHGASAIGASTKAHLYTTGPTQDIRSSFDLVSSGYRLTTTQYVTETLAGVIINTNPLLKAQISITENQIMSGGYVQVYRLPKMVT